MKLALTILLASLATTAAASAQTTSVTLNRFISSPSQITAFEDGTIVVTEPLIILGGVRYTYDANPNSDAGNQTAHGLCATLGKSLVSFLSANTFLDTREPLHQNKAQLFATGRFRKITAMPSNLRISQLICR